MYKNGVGVVQKDPFLKIISKKSKNLISAKNNQI